jgi:hypothetical protein
MSVTIPAWAIPAFVTLIAFCVAIWAVPEQRGDYDFSAAIFAPLLLALALIVSLVAWLCWALVA